MALTLQIGYTADRVQFNFLQLLNSDAAQRVTVVHLERYHSVVLSSIEQHKGVGEEEEEVDRLNNAKAHRLERLKTRSLLFRGPGKELLGANERRPVVIQSTCEVRTALYNYVGISCHNNTMLFPSHPPKLINFHPHTGQELNKQRSSTAKNSLFIYPTKTPAN